MRILVICLLALPFLLLNGCGDDITAPFPEGVTFTSDKDVYEIGERITVTLYNGSVRTVHVWDGGCPPYAEREVDSVWTQHPLFTEPVVCPAVEPITRPLAPGESRTRIITAQGSEDFLVAGRYRLSVNLAREPFGARVFLGSEAFVVEEAP